MSAVKHTPGPWKLVHFGGPQISGPGGYAVCTMWGALSADSLRAKDRANARLIAAAPDMLEALRVAEVALSMTDAPPHNEAREQVLVAIARATGDA